MSVLATRIVSGARRACFWDFRAQPNGEQFDPMLVNVQYAISGGSPETLYYVDSAVNCDTEGGWYYDNPVSPTQIIVCPATCRVVEAAPDVSVEFQYGCYTTVCP